MISPQFPFIHLSGGGCSEAALGPQPAKLADIRRAGCSDLDVDVVNENERYKNVYITEFATKMNNNCTFRLP